MDKSILVEPSTREDGQTLQVDTESSSDMSDSEYSEQDQVPSQNYWKLTLYLAPAVCLLLSSIDENSIIPIVTTSYITYHTLRFRNARDMQ